jgi:transposase
MNKKTFNTEETNNIIKYYVDGGLSCSNIGLKYGCSKTPIINLLKINGLLREGKSNGKKITVSIEQMEKIKTLYLNEYKNTEEISKLMNLTKSLIEKILANSNYRRNKSFGTSIGMVKRFRNVTYDVYLNEINEYYKYKLEVIKHTKKQPINTLLNFEKRGNSGVNGAHHLDHKYSINEGFKNKISPNIIGNIINLEFIPWEENIRKRTKCSINKKDLKIK